MIDTFLFDLDGTLIDTLDDITTSVNSTLVRFGEKSMTRSQVRSCIGDGIVKLVERILPNLSGERFNEALLFYRAEYKKHQFDNTRPYDGILEVLRELKSVGYKVGVVTNKREAAAIELVERFFGGLVDLVIGDDFARPLKPNPAPLEFALGKLGSVTTNAVFVGDSEMDMQAAKSAKIRAIGVTWGYRDGTVLESYKADKLITHPKELLTIK